MWMGKSLDSYISALGFCILIFVLFRFSFCFCFEGKQHKIDEIERVKERNTYLDIEKKRNIR